ncbi:MAG: N-acetyl-alpha-D-glucosaminyl L-malate synthase BshA [Bdellovibrionales bacterium]|nr:N-acetyl-alpha-D-glucosaminyl L-malate synthase BshA [Bdellovibrionales bacterium]
MEPLRIGITCFPTFGGSGVIATEIGMAMAQRGHRVHFICYDIPRRLERFTENIYFHEVEVSEYPLFAYTPYSLALSSKMVEVTTYERLQILHVHYAVPHATSAYLARQVLGSQAPRVITTLHGTDITLVGNNRSYLPITRFSIVESDIVTTPSQYLKHATYDKLNVSTETPIEVIPNFVDTDLYCPPEDATRADMRQSLGICASAEFVLTHVSNFRPVKRLGDVVDVFARVNERVPSHLVLIGDGPERSRIERMVHDRGLANRVCFLGKQDSFVKILRGSDLFLLPSENESFGLAALEAMSCGVPVIASNTEGIPEVVAHGVTGFLSDVGDTREMAENAIKLLEDQTLHASFRHAARMRVLENFERQKTIDRYEQLYARVLS